MSTRKYTGLPYTEYTVAAGHFDTTRSPIVEIILHSSASTEQGLIDTFGGGTRMVSAHYGINNDGKILAFLEEYYTAYHAGDYTVNQKSIGIEHVDEGPTVKKHTDVQYTTSIKLVADICKFYSIPCDDKHILPHSAIIATSCPNGLDVTRIIEGAAKLLNPSDPCDDIKQELSDMRDSRDSWKSQYKDLKTQYDSVNVELGTTKTALMLAQAKLTIVSKDKDVLQASFDAYKAQSKTDLIKSIGLLEFLTAKFGGVKNG